MAVRNRMKIFYRPETLSGNPLTLINSYAGRETMKLSLLLTLRPGM
ncbi:hypothetical protein MJ581_19880 [Escherichia coli]|nr:hypothetical protein MJ581_19880 [Escherichia coli]